MRSTWWAALLIPLSGACSSGAGPTNPPPALPAGEVIEGAIVVDFRDGITAAEVDAEETPWGVDLSFNSVAGPANGLALSRGAIPGNVDALLETIRKDPDVEHAERLYLYQATFVPNDPRYEEQWHLTLMRMPEAWERSTGKGVIVAVVDTGVAFEDHGDFRRVEDLDASRMVPGWDFVGDDEHANDDMGHGTHVAGTIAQSTDNGIGVAGVAYEAKIMPVKVLAAGGGTSADIADGIRWAADHGAKVINLSLGGGARSEVMEAAVKHARAKGVTVVAAAGNSGRGCRQECIVSFPAAYDGVIAVSAVGPDGALASYSSWGKELDIAAPGGEKASGEKNGVLQATIPDGDPGKTVYEFYQGTSMASPHVAGLAALLIAAGVESPDAVEKAIYESAVDKGEPGWDPKYGHGLIDAEAALSRGGSGKGLVAIGWRLGLAAALAALARVSVKRRKLEPPSVDLGFAGAAVMACAGLFFLRWIGLDRLPLAGTAFALASSPVPDWGRYLLDHHPGPLFYSAILPLGFAFVSLPFLRTRQLAAGLCIGFSAFLLQAAWAAPAIAWLPSPWLSVPWLAANAIAGWFLSRELLRYSAQRRAAA